VTVSATTGHSRAAALGRLWADARKVDRTQSDPFVAARNGVGVVVPLVVATALGHPAYGLLAAIGAIQAAFADRPGPYRRRVTRMLATAVAAGITAGLAAAVGQSLVASAVLLAVCAFAAGQLLSAGPSAARVGIAATASALVIGHIPEPPALAAGTGLLVFAGGAVQTVLAIAAWPLRRHGPERRSLARLYSELANLAANPVDPGSSPPLGAALAETTEILRGAGHDHGPSVEAYLVLLDLAERIRQDVLVLSAYAVRLREKGGGAGEAVVQAALQSAGSVLATAGDTLRSRRPPDEAGQQRSRDVIASIRDAAEVLRDSVTERAAANRIRSLAGKLRAAVETSRTGATEGRLSEDSDAPSTGLRLRDPIEVVRANLDLRSSALRHATRLAVLVPLTDVATRAAAIPRGYWVSLTILVVLRPDFGGTFHRALLRALGTMIGLVLASVVVYYLLNEQPAAMIPLLGLLVFGMRLAGPNNVGLSAMFLSGTVVVLLSLGGYPTGTTVAERAIATAVGGVIALVAVLLWPSWERSQVTDRLADMVAAYRDYLRMMVDPAMSESRRAAQRAHTRLARSNAEASVDRARSEPVDPRGTVELGDSILANGHRLAHALLAIDSIRKAYDTYQQVPEFGALSDASLETLLALERAVRKDVPFSKHTHLRRLQADLAAALANRPEGQLPGHAAVLVEATDRLVDSLDSLAATLSRRAILKRGSMAPARVDPA
jgi:uncharacterized membrane protein YccC